MKAKKQIQIQLAKRKMTRIRITIIDSLLGILRQNLIPNLPKSTKTCLSTTKPKYIIEEMEGRDGSAGEFVYFTIKKGLEKYIDPAVFTNEVIELKFCIDGLPLNKSGYNHLWPILCQIHSLTLNFKPLP